jgi:hypothetical protein
MDRKLISAAALACAAAFTYAPSFAQGDEQQRAANAAAPDDDALDSSDSATTDDSLSSRSVYIVRDPRTGEIYLLVPDGANPGIETDTDEAVPANPNASEPIAGRVPFRGVTMWA